MKPPQTSVKKESSDKLRRLTAASIVAKVAAVVTTSDSKEIGIGPPERTASTNASSCRSWPLSTDRRLSLFSLARCSRARRNESCRTGRLGPGPLPRSFFGIPRITGGEVLNRRPPIRSDSAESSVRLSMSSSVAAADHFDGVASQPPGGGVDEMATLPGEPGAFGAIPVPASRRQWPGVDGVAQLDRPQRLPTVLELIQKW